MLQLLSFAGSLAVMAVSIGVIVVTLQAEMHAILTALGMGSDTTCRPVAPAGERRVRVIRQPQMRSVMQPGLRAVA